MSAFDGFSEATFEFLSELGRNNEKAWFDANRARYEEHYLTPAKAFVEALAAPLAKLSSDIEAQPRVNGSIFRINRDIRFSKDKTPYKDHMDFWFWEGERKGALSGLFLRLTEDGAYIGAGTHGFDPDRLKVYRKKVTDPKKRQQLAGIEKKLASASLELHGETYKRTPRGFEPAHENEDRYLRHSSLSVSIDHPLPDEVHTAGFVDWCVAGWKPMVPLHRWLVDEVQ